MATTEVEEVGKLLRAFVFPGQGSGVVEPEDGRLAAIRGVIGEMVPDQVKLFSRAAEDADESRVLGVHPDVVAGHSLGEYGAAYAAGCFDFETGLRLVARRDHLLAEAAERVPGGMVAVLKSSPEEVEKALEGTEGSFIANYNSPRQTVISGLRDALNETVERIRGRTVRLNVSFAAHSPYVSSAAERMRESLESVEFRPPEVPFVSAMDGAVLHRAEEVKEALKEQMVAPVRWVRVVDTLARLRVEEWVELGGGGVLTRMLRDFESPLKGVTFEDLRERVAGLPGQARSLFPGAPDTEAQAEEPPPEER